MLEPKTFDWSDLLSTIKYETQLENLKKKDHCLDTTKQYSENASTSEEGGSVASPGMSSSSKFSSHYKSIREKADQIRNLYGSVVFLNVFDLTADITGADFIQFYDPIRIDSIIKYPTSTMLDLEFSCKEDAIRALEKGVGMINGCLFSVRVSKRNYNPNITRQRRVENERYYAKKDYDVVTYTKKAEGVPEEKAPEIKVEEVVPSVVNMTENNLEETLQKILSIETSQSQTETGSEGSETAKTLDVIHNDVSLASSPKVSAQSVNMNLTSPQPKKTLGKAMRTPPMKVGKYRNIVRSSENKTQSTTSTFQPSAEEMEKVNKLQKQLIEQFLQEKEALERIQREKAEQERLEKDKEEARIRAIEEEKQREEEESVKAEEKAKEEEETSKPVRKEVYEKIIYQQRPSWRDDRYYRDDDYYRGNRYGGYGGSGYSNYNDRYSSRSGAYKFATVEREYTVKKNF